MWTKKERLRQESQEIGYLKMKNKIAKTWNKANGEMVFRYYGSTKKKQQ